MAPWAQWFINNNLRWLLYVVAGLYVPFAVFMHIFMVTLPELYKEITRDFRSIGTAKKTK